MSMKWWITGALLCLAVVAVPRQAVSQSRADIELNLFAGTSFFTQESFEIGPPQSQTPIPMTFDLDSDLRGGLRLNFITAEKWGVEAFSSYEATTAAIRRDDNAVPELRFPVQHYRFGVDLLYYPLGSEGRNRIVPFVLGGGGASIYLPTAEAKRIASDPLRGNLPDLIESSRGLAIYGVGLKYRLTNSIGFRADVQGGITRNPTFGLDTASEEPTDTVFPLTGYSHNIGISVGITIKLF